MSARSFRIASLVLLAMAAARAQSFSYYLLSMSYAPDFCAEAGGNKDARECGPGRRLGFVVHGLWPQAENGRGPERCGSGRPIAASLVQTMLSYIPSESLIQHEWTTHGTCSGLSAADYFALVRKARDSVTIPADLKEPGSPMRLQTSDVEAKFAAANPKFPSGAVRISCYRDAELQEVRVCFTKDLVPRACGAQAGTCRSGTVTLNPVR